MIYDTLTLTLVIFSDMKSSTRHLCIVLLAALLGVYLLGPKADAAEQCSGSMCLHCGGMLFSVNESAAKFGFDNHMCDVTFGKSTCNLDNNSNSNIAVVMVPATNPNRQDAGALFGFVGYNRTQFQDVRINIKADRFRFTSDTIPIYLQNLSFLC